MPSDDIAKASGDVPQAPRKAHRLVILATIEGLRAIEQGKLNQAAKSTFVQIEKVTNEEAAFEGANTIVRITGCDLSLARNLMNKLPQTLPIPLYKHQAQRLVRELNKALVKAYMVSPP